MASRSISGNIAHDAMITWTHYAMRPYRHMRRFGIDHYGHGSKSPTLDAAADTPGAAAPCSKRRSSSDDYRESV
jgi:hypothetical protein